MRASEAAHPLLTQWLGLSIMVMGALVDLPARISVGWLSLEGIFSIICLLMGLFLVLITPAHALISFKLWPLLLFLGWATLSLAWSDFPLHGAQNIIVLGCFLVLMQLSEKAAATTRSFACVIDSAIMWSAIVAASLYCASLVPFGPGNDEFISARCFGCFATYGVGHYLSKWRYGSSRALWIAIALTLLIGASQSRLALGIALLLFPLAQLPGARTRNVLKVLIATVAITGASYWAFQYFDSFRARFLTGDMSMKLGDIAINASGRTKFWGLILQSFWDSPIWGKGAGSAEGVINSAFVEIQHPHSDYLRVLHDYGILGMTLWLLAIGVIAVSLWRRWSLAARLGSADARFYLGAMLALVAFVLNMTTDNVLVYTFIVAPLALIVGSALGLKARVRVVQKQGLS